MDNQWAKLHVLSFGLTLGILWALSLFLMGIIAGNSGFAAGFVTSIGTVYIGYKATLTGSLLGALWGFIDAGVGGLLIAWIYNLLLKVFCKE